MALEKWWNPVRVPFTANGTIQGVVTVADATGFFNKQTVQLTSNSFPAPGVSLEVKWVSSPTTIVVGLPGTGLFQGADVSSFLVSDNAIISAPQQKIPAGPTPDEIIKAVYQRDPTVAIRTFLVDTFGDGFDENNPLPVSFSSTFPNVVKIADGGGSGNELKVNADGSINVITQSGLGAIENVESTFNAITSIASGAYSLVATYTTPLSITNGYLQVVEMSGDCIAKFDILINSVIVGRKRTYWGEFNATSDWRSPEPSRGYQLNPDDVVQVFVTNNSENIGSFEARIQVLEVTS